MIASKMIPKAVCLFSILLLLTPLFNICLADALECEKEVEIYAPDPSEYKQITEEEVLELQFLEDEYGSFIIEEVTPSQGEIVPNQIGSLVTFCTEASCGNVTVTFGGVTNQYYATCLNVLGFYNIPEGTYFFTASCPGGLWAGSFYVNGFTTYNNYLCPTDLPCCLAGCLSGASFYCSNCLTNTTTTSYTPTTSIPSPNLVFKNHMMTKDPKYNSQCETPKRADTFYHYDEAAHCWMLWQNASGKETIKCEWYKPDGELYRDVSTQSEYVNGCWYPFIGIDGYEPAYTSGNWRVDVYVGGNKRFSEYFIIEGLTSTSTTTSIITTTTTTMPPPPAPTKQMSSFSMRVMSSDS